MRGPIIARHQSRRAHLHMCVRLSGSTKSQVRIRNTCSSPPIGPRRAELSSTRVSGMAIRRIVFVDHRSSHHAAPSGYGRLTEFIVGDTVPERALRFPPWRIQRAFAGHGGAAYSTVSFSKELALLLRMLEPGAGLAHFLNVENDFSYTRLWSRPLGWRVTGTFHFPPSRFADLFPTPRYLRHLDGAICVASNQLNAVRDLVQHDRVWVVPLGVDLEFFRPADVREETTHPICLFVGTHLRDFATLGRVAEILADEADGASIVAIVPSRYAAQVPVHPRITLQQDVSDIELRYWYQTADLLLLPLLDSTATQAILEAMACGTPIVATDVGGVRDYVDSACAVLTPPNDSDAMANAARRIWSEGTLRSSMRIAARQRALAFAWPKIARAVMDTYSAIPA
jgi:glycosyltransferase involved in cell wall biosynthesis